MTSNQRSIWFDQKLHAHSSLYNVGGYISINGIIDPDLFSKAIDILILQNDSLRISIEETDGYPVLEFSESTGNKLNFRDFSSLPDPIASCMSWMNESAVESLQFETNELFVFTLLKASENHFFWHIKLHHLISDGWSISLIVSKTAEIYTLLAQGEEIPPQLVYSYKEYMEDDHKYLSSESFLIDSNYWKQQFDSIPPPLTIGKPIGKSKDIIYTSGRKSIYLKRKLYNELNLIAESHKVSVFHVFIGALYLYFSRIQNTPDLVIGLPILNRSKATFKKTIGLFTGMSPLRMDYDPEISFNELIIDIKNSLRENFRYQRFPIDEIYKIAKLREHGLDRLFDISLSYEKHDYTAKFNGIATESEALPHYHEKLPLAIYVREYTPEQDVKLDIDYNHGFWDEFHIDQFVTHFEHLLHEISVSPGKRINRYDLLPEVEKNRILYEWNNTDALFSDSVTLHSLFEQQAERTPRNIAAVFEDKQITYFELNNRANQLAQLLAQNGIGIGSCVGVALERSIDMLIAVMGIVKAGAAYVPVEPDFPEARIHTIFNNTRVSGIVTQYSLSGLFNRIQWKLDDLETLIYMDVQGENPPIETIDNKLVEELWDHVADTAVDEISAGGFISSYSGKPFSDKEVSEYKEHVLSLCKPYTGNNKSVLEIGCGSGLITFPLAELVGEYKAIDPSEKTIAKNKKTALDKGITNIKFSKGFAHELNGFGAEKFDLILVASTVQFFPGYFYLEDFLKQSLSLLKPDGVIILADIMDDQRKEEFRQSLEAFNLQNNGNDEIRTKLDLDNELYVHEHFFHHLQALTDIGEVQIIKRKTGFKNELSFRYDVIILNSLVAPILTNQPQIKKRYTNRHLLNQPDCNLDLPVTSDDTAYIIHTSGSTGVPKGVVVTHKPVVNLIEWVNKTYTINQHDRGLFVTSICFDLSVYDIFGMLATGGSLHIASNNDVRNPEQLLDILREQPITFWNSAPATLQQVVTFFEDEKKKEIKNNTLRLVFLSGDWIPLTLPDKLKTLFKDVQVTSLGGATEAAIWSNYYEINEIDPNWLSIPYGKPIQNAKYLILDSNLQPVPIGATGDLYIGGNCLAQGYINDRALTNSKFITDPFSNNLDAKMYKTGDLARWFPDGNIEFLGRKDSQVKIRGYRIELGEIEVQLLKHSAIKEVVVLDRTDSSGVKYLCAYFIANEEVSITEIRSFLSQVLPDYMIPANYIRLDKIPLTNNGKIDRQALSAIESVTEVKTGKEYAEPETESEILLAGFWKELLGINRVGALDNFFELGGHSLKATQLASRIFKHTGSKISLSDIFHYPTIRLLGKILDEKEITIENAILPVAKKEYYELSASQLRIWVLEQTNDQSHAYNIPMAAVLNETIDWGILKQAIALVVDKHAALRTCFVTIEGIPYQKIIEKAEFSIEAIDLVKPGTQSLPQIVKEHIAHSFDLSVAPLFKVTLVKTEDQNHLFLFTIHHIISDGWSMRVFLEELSNNYRQIAINGKVVIEPLQVQYTDYSNWLNKLLESEKGKEHQKYWQQKLSGKLEPLSLPIDFERPSVRSYSGAVHRIQLKEEIKLGLQQLARESGSSMFMVLQTAIKIMLYKITGQKDIIIGTSVAGRAQKETENQIGLYVNTLPLRTEVKDDESFMDLLSQVKMTSLEAFEHQAYPFDRLVEDLDANFSRNRNPLFDVMITMDDQHMEGNDFFNVDHPIIKELETEYNVSKFDLTFSFDTRGEGLHLSLVYNPDLYRSEKVHLIGRYLENTIDQSLQNPQLSIGNFSLINGIEPELFQFLNLASTEYESAYPLTTTQRDIYLTSILHPNDEGLRLLAYFIVDRNIDTDRWKEAIRIVTQQETVLRTSIISSPELFQAVRKFAEINFELIDLKNEAAGETDFTELVKKHANLNQDIAHPLVKHYLFKVHDSLFITALSAHHVLLDGTSFPALVEKIDRIYTTLTEKKNSVFFGEKEYKNYALNHLNKFDTQPVEQFWRDKLKEVEPLTYTGTISSDKNHIADVITIDGTEAENIKAYCSNHKIKPDVFFKALYSLLVKYYCNAEHDFCLRENLFGRTKDYLHAIGCFSQTLPLPIEKVSLEQEKFVNFCHYLRKQKESVKAYSHISVSLQNRIIGDEPLSFFFNYQKFLQPKTNLGLSILHQVYHIMDNQVEMRIAETSDGFELLLDYNESIFNGKDFLNRMMHISSQALSGVEQISELEYVTEKEKTVLLEEFNQPEVEVNKDIIHLIDEQVLQQPESIAVIFRDRQITYKELSERANAVANHLITELNTKPGDVIGILVDRSEWTVVSMLGVLKSGSAYLPIDPDYPEERIAYMLQDSGASVLLTHTNLSDKVTFTGKTVTLDTIDFDTKKPVERSLINPSDSAYVIYTSGTTGNPKGVMVAHNSLTNIANAWKKTYRLDAFQVNLLQIASFSFDVFTGDVIRTLTNGGKMVICPSEVRLDVVSLYNLLQTHRISIVESTPALIIPLMEYVYQEGKDVQFLKLLILGSDSCPIEQYKKLLSRFGEHIRIINSYGVTEATIDSSYYEEAFNNLPLSGNTPIGKPLQNTALYVLNQHNNLVPIGVPGELHIGGHGVALGYVNNETLTTQKFIQNPFKKGEKMYKTGDVVRWLPNGNLEFTGRNDEQVKVRGYRIELKEIENCLLKNARIKDAIVTVRSDEENEKHIFAYFIPKDNIGIPELRAYLKAQLPEFMLPSYFIELETIPLTPNGKVDKNALPGLDTLATPNENYEPPRNETDRIVLSIWEDVLKRTNLGINDNFFECGGHSLKATTLVSRIHKGLQADVPLSIVFKTPTVKEISDYIKNQSPGKYDKIEGAAEQPFYPLSSAQKRLYLLHQIEGAETTYNMPGALTIAGEIDIQLFENVFQKLIARHEILRTSFSMQNGEPVQWIHENVPFNIHYRAENKEEISNLIKSFVHSFDLSIAPLFRVSIIRLADEKHLLLFDMHHIISDGVSMNRMIQEIFRDYNGLEVAEQTIQYKDYAVWQQEFLKSKKINEQEQYWLSQFEDEVPIIAMPTDFTRPTVKSFAGERLQIKLNADQTQQIREFATQNEFTLFHLLLTTYSVLLSRYSGNEDLVIGTPIAARRHQELEHVIGVFVNTLALRNLPSSDKTFISFLREVRENSIAAMENQDYPFEMLIEKLDLKRDMSRNPLFDHLFSFLQQEHTELKLGDAVIEPLQEMNATSKFDILLEAVDCQDTMRLNFEYSTELFKEETIGKFATHFIHLLLYAASNPSKTLASLSMLSEEEKGQLLVDFNDTYADYPREKCIHQLFEEQVFKTPDNIALVFDDEQLTYAELNAKADQLARAILNDQKDTEKIVAILAERSMEMVIGILGILKSGCAYLPIDPDYPATRIEYMLQDSGASTLIVHGELPDQLTFTGKIIPIKEAFSSTYEVVEEQKKINKTAPSDLAYIIYTSGTTGQPKGVMIEHRNVVRLFFNDKNVFDFNSEDVWTLFHSYCFDFSVWEMYGALLHGGKLIIVPKIITQSPKNYLQLVASEHVTVLNQTPGSFYNLIHEAHASEHLNMSLRYVIFGGEALKPGKLKEWKLKYPEIRLINMYGITETTVHVTYKEITDFEIRNNRSNIGKPIPTLSMLVLDKHQNLLPVGVPGELCVGGEGLAQGYLHKPELTNEKFIDHPFVPGEKLYRSGDLVKILSTGEFEYLGRIDHQVKIRGFRIELGEIESCLLTYKDVKDAVVIDRADKSGVSYLCAYIVSDTKIEVPVVRNYIGKQLPDYMIPSYFISLDSLPLTSNGKVNRKALPLPEAIDYTSSNEYIAPTNSIEEKLVAIWEEILNLKKIGISDNFFELGGHSLKAAVLAMQIHKEFDVEIPLKLIFSNPVISALASYISSSERSLFSSIEPAESTEFYPVSSAEKRLFILNQMDNSGISYNIPGVFIIEGACDIQKLQRAIVELIHRHEILRTSFTIRTSDVFQKINEQTDFDIEVLEIDEEQLEETVKNFIRPFDLSHAPLMRVGIIQATSGKNFLLFDIHHIIADGVSIEVLIKEISDLYDGKRLEPLRIHYKDYAVWQQSWLKSDKGATQKQFWLSRFADEVPIVDMPTDYLRPSIKSFEGARYNFKLSHELTLKIKEIAQEHSVTPFMLFLSFYTILLSKYSSQDDIVIGTPVAGRQHADLQHLIGVFVNTLPLRNMPSSDKSFKVFLEEVKENSLKALQNSDYPFEELLEHLDIHRDMSRNPLFDFMFTYQEGTNEAIELQELKLKSYPFDGSTAKMDMSLEVFGEENGAFTISIEYATKIFAQETIRKFSQHFIKIISDIADNPSISLGAIEIITADEKQQIINEFNNTAIPFSKEKSISELFEKQAALTPDNFAIVYDQEKLTYGEVSQRANKIAASILTKSFQTDDRVGILMSRSASVIVSVFGILKAGGAYVYIDPDYPEDRIAHILSDSGCRILLTDEVSFSTAKKFPGMDVINTHQINQSEGQTVAPSSQSGSLAYVIYTSGSTGKPKGVAIEQKSVINLSNWFNQQYALSPGANVLQMTNMAFDVSVEESIVPLLHGATVFIAAKETMLNKKQFRDFIINNEIHIAQFVPATLRELVAENELMPSLKTLICGGEQLEESLKEKVLKMGYNLFNHYGPTETTVDSLSWKCELNERHTFFEDRTIHASIAESAELYPNKIAVEIGEEHITYSELNERANTLAGIIQQHGGGKDKIVGILSEKSIDLIIGLLAILKSGAAYLPIDPGYPTDRINYMLEDSGSILLLTQEQLKNKSGFKGTQLILEDLNTFGKEDRIQETGSAENLAYVIYTSGSTGKPKGVQIEHRSVNNFLFSIISKFNDNFSHKDVCLSLTNISFDVSVFEIFIPLTIGAKLVLLDKHSIYDIHQLAKTIIDKKITFTYIPPTILSDLYIALKLSNKHIHLNKLLVGVEPIKDNILEAYLTLNDSMQVINGYGPTEATISCSLYQYESHKPKGSNVPIGKPINNTRIYIVNENNHLQPIGIPGELCIAGLGIARGYLNNPELTSQKFTDNPFEPGTNMYRTGDLAKWLPDGNIEFIGRKDYQVKIRGFRIELGEIENRIFTYDSVKQVIVIDKTDKGGNKYLCAYLISDTDISIQGLREYLRKELPEYMIPSFFVVMDKFPLTKNEKIDRKALPEPKSDKLSAESEVVKPSNDVEEKLLAIWEKTLQISPISITDNFFEIGGNSLKIIAVFSMIQDEFGEVIQVNDLFDKPTIQQLAQLVITSETTEVKEVKRARRVEF